MKKTDPVKEDSFAELIDQAMWELDGDPEWIQSIEPEPFDPSVSMLVDLAEQRRHEAFYRDEIIEQIMSVLIGMNKPNVLLTGPAGSGKTNIVEELAFRLADPKRRLPAKLKGRRIYALKLSDLVSGSNLVGDLESKLSSLLNYLQYPSVNAILFLDEIHMLYCSEAYRKIAQILKPALSRGTLSVIGATTTQEAKALEEDPAFSRRFTRIPVDELTAEQTACIIERIYPAMEKHYGIKLLPEDDLAAQLVRIADESLAAGSHRPDNAVTLLDRTIAIQLVKRNRKSLRLTAAMAEMTALRIASGNSREKAFNERALRKSLGRIRGQNDILEELIRVIRLYDLHIRPRTKPLTFLFAGPSGVGKTETARILSSEYFGEKPIILNLSEYSSDATVNRILGSPAGYIGSNSNKEMPFDKLESNPYQLILLDEFEKSCREVQRLFLSVFETGFLTTSFGKQIDFRKTIIIATTNAGCAARAGKFGFGAGSGKDSLTVSGLSEEMDVELLNRFSHRFTFQHIDRSTYIAILRDIYKKELSLLNTKHLGKSCIRLLLHGMNDQVLEELAAASYHPEFGARPAETAVIDYIDSLISESVRLSGTDAGIDAPGNTTGQNL